MERIGQVGSAAVGVAYQGPAGSYKKLPPAFRLKRQVSQLEITGGQVFVQIDQTRCFAERGLKPPTELAREAARLGTEAALEGIGRWAAEGDFLAAIEKGGTFADLAMPAEKVEVVLALLPQCRPVIEFVYLPLVIRAYRTHGQR